MDPYPFLEIDPHVGNIAFLRCFPDRGILHYRMQALTDVPNVLEQVDCVRSLL